MVTRQQLVAYFNQHKARYPIALLKSQLLKQGVPESEIEEALWAVMASPAAAPAQGAPAQPAKTVPPGAKPPEPTPNRPRMAQQLPRGMYEPVLITPDMLDNSSTDATRLDFEKGISWFPTLTCRLIAVNGLVFVWEFLRGALWSTEALIDAGALYRPALVSGEYWRLFTPMFLHGSLGHLFGNCAALYVLGIAAEHAFSRASMFALYVFSGVSCCLLSAAMHPGPAVGASGAIFGLMAGVIVFMARYRESFVMRNRRVGIVLIFWALYQIGQGFLVPYVDNAGHVGGFLGGLLFSCLMKPKALRIGNPADSP